MDEYLINKINAFREMQIWPREASLQVNAWRNSFPEGDRWLADKILRNLIYLNTEITEKLLSKAIVEATLPRSPESPEIGFTWPTRPEIDHTESGRLFARMLRDDFSIDPANFKYPSEALLNAFNSKFNQVVFVDDLLGSGDQLFKSLHQPSPRQMFSRDEKLLDLIQSTPSIKVCACFAVACSTTLEWFSKYYPEIEIFCGSVLDPDHGLSVAHSLAFDNSTEAADAYEAIIRLSSKYLSLEESDAFGLNGEGHLLVFQHGPPPDLSLPLLYKESSGWTPLKRRT